MSLPYMVNSSGKFGYKSTAVERTEQATTARRGRRRQQLNDSRSTVTTTTTLEVASTQLHLLDNLRDGWFIASGRNLPSSEDHSGTTKRGYVNLYQLLVPSHHYTATQNADIYTVSQKRINLQ